VSVRIHFTNGESLVVDEAMQHVRDSLIRQGGAQFTREGATQVVVLAASVTYAEEWDSDAPPLLDVG
jgi:hypothetical protein